jgi:hypothetical protein
VRSGEAQSWAADSFQAGRLALLPVLPPVWVGTASVVSPRVWTWAVLRAAPAAFARDEPPGASGALPPARLADWLRSERHAAPQTAVRGVPRSG